MSENYCNASPTVATPRHTSPTVATPRQSCNASPTVAYAIFSHATVLVHFYMLWYILAIFEDQIAGLL
jgi:hypothetical protein